MSQFPRSCFTINQFSVAFRNRIHSLNMITKHTCMNACVMILCVIDLQTNYTYKQHYNSWHTLRVSGFLSLWNNHRVRNISTRYYMLHIGMCIVICGRIKINVFKVNIPNFTTSTLTYINHFTTMSL